MRILLIIVVAILMVWGFMAMRSPHGTALRLDTTDLTPIRPKLDKLPQEERDLVLGYLERSRGDVLPASMADPDQPFTARTFGEAIKLQRQFLEQQAKIDAQVQARRAERDKALAPLRAALGIRLVGREIVERGDLLQPRGAAEHRTVKQAIDNTPVMVTTYRLENRSESAIASADASVNVRKARPERAELGILSSCWITHSEPLAPGKGTDVRCANTQKTVSRADRLFVDMPERDFVIEWEPKLIRFADGKELKFQD